MLKTCVETIKDTLDHLPGNERTHVGFITFDSSVHFYHLKSSLSQPRMLVVSDLDDVSPPIPDDLLVNLKESRAVVDSLLGALFPLFFVALTDDWLCSPLGVHASEYASSRCGCRLCTQSSMGGYGNYCFPTKNY